MFKIHNLFIPYKIRCIQITRTVYKNHYEVLNLQRSCSPKEIRNSFIKLSKQLHPDKNKNQNTHDKFIQITEAYNTLSCPEKRVLYDLSLPNSSNSNENHTSSWPKGTFRDETIWEYRNKSHDKNFEDKPYYGIKGLKKISNKWIVAICLMVSFMGAVAQILAIKHSFTLKREILDQQSKDNSMFHSSLRAQALENGNEVQIERIKQKLDLNNNLYSYKKKSDI